MEFEKIECSPVLTIPEVAKFLKVSNGTVWRWVASGKLSSIKIAGTRRVRQDDFEAFLNSGGDKK